MTTSNIGSTATAARDLIVGGHHTALCVHDFDGAIRFFTDFIGMELEWSFDRRDGAMFEAVTGVAGAVARMAMLRLGTYRIELFKYLTPQSDRAAQKQCDVGYTHIAFEVQDVDEVYERLIKAGYTTTTPPVELRAGYSKLVYAYAPENAVIEFIQFLDGSTATASDKGH